MAGLRPDALAVIACALACWVMGGCTAMHMADVAPKMPGVAPPPCSGSKQDKDADYLATVEYIKTHPLPAVDDVRRTLPPAMQTDPVVDAFLGLASNSIRQGNDFLLMKTVALAPPPPPDIGQRELRNFAENVLREEMKPTIENSRSQLLAGSGTIIASTLPDAFVTYLKAYYNGKYYDRFGGHVQQPSLSLAISDQEIAGAVTILIDYIIDSIDTTPIWGSTSTPQDGSTKFYPGGNTSEPTRLTVTFTGIPDPYQIISTGSCGMNIDKLNLLGDLTSAAGDAGGAVSGLVAGSFGGFEVGLGFLGKFSFGDDQTLTNIVKAAAARLSARVTLAALWPVLASMDYAETAPPIVLKSP